MATFEIHLEDWNHALHIDGRGHKSDVRWLFDKLVNIPCHVYVLEKWREENPNEPIHSVVGSHGRYHYYDEKADRSPYFNQEGLPFPPSGGFFFRLLPIWYLKWAIMVSGVFWVHPHDLDESHPRLSNPLMDFKRRVGLRGAKAKLEKLLKEVKFE